MRGDGNVGQPPRDIPCWNCGKFHGAECPKLEPLKKEELLALAKSVEAGWASQK